MERKLNAELVSQGLVNLENLYRDSSRKDGIHATDLIYCLTRSWYDKCKPLPPTPDEVMLFSIGWGLQQVMFPIEQQMEPVEIDGIICSPDFKSRAGAAELKTTRMSAMRKNKTTGISDYAEFPETWVEQIKAYCYVTKQTEYDLLVLHLLGSYNPPFPILVGWKLTFEWEEIVQFWYYLMSRKEILDHALLTTMPPTPYQYCKEWECKNCRDSLRCKLDN